MKKKTVCTTYNSHTCENRFYTFLMRIGSLTGCHQLPERSLFWSGYQFPLCARCTGAFLGQTVALITYWFFIPHLAILIVFCGAMLLDWLLQYLDMMKSTNFRRVVTGSLCGYALMTIHITVLLAVAAYLFQIYSAKELFLSAVNKLI